MLSHLSSSGADFGAGAGGQRGGEGEHSGGGRPTSAGAPRPARETVSQSAQGGEPSTPQPHSLPEMGASASEAVSRGFNAFRDASLVGGPAMILAAGLALVAAAIAMDDSALAWPGVPLVLTGGLAGRVKRLG